MNYTGGLKRILDSYMDDNKNMENEKVDSLASDFLETIEKVKIIFGSDGSFRRWLPESRKWKQQVSAPLYDSQMFACYKKNKEKITANKDSIVRDYKKLFTKDNEFIESIESSTASPTRFLYRAKKLDEIIRKHI